MKGFIVLLLALASFSAIAQNDDVELIVYNNIAPIGFVEAAIAAASKSFYFATTITGIRNGRAYTLPATGIEYEIVFTSKANSGYERPIQVHVITAASGVQISVGEDITADTYAFPEESKPVFTFLNGSRNMRVKGTQNDVVVFTY